MTDGGGVEGTVRTVLSYLFVAKIRTGKKIAD